MKKRYRGMTYCNVRKQIKPHAKVMTIDPKLDDLKRDKHVQKPVESSTHAE